MLYADRMLIPDVLARRRRGEGGPPSRRREWQNVSFDDNPELPALGEKRTQNYSIRAQEGRQGLAYILGLSYRQALDSREG